MEKRLSAGAERVAPDIFDCPDGKRRWIYEVSLLQNPTVLITLLKVFLGIVLGIAIMMFFILLGDGFAEAGTFFLKFLGIVGGIMLGLVLVSYCIYAAIQGGKYVVVFEMDEKGVKHTQLPRQFEKAKALAELTFLMGAATGSPATMGAGLLAGAKASSYSSFKNVRKVIAKRRRRAILLSEPMEHNQVYADKERFDEILDYIIARCPKARVRR